MNKLDNKLILYIKKNKDIIQKYITPKYIFYRLDEISTKLIKFLNTNNIMYFLNQGSLIGSVKYNNLLYWDIDFDICIFDENIISNQKFIKNFINKEKLKLKKRKDSLVYQLCEEKYVYDKCKLPTFDLCILKLDNKGNYYTPINKKLNKNTDYYDRFINNYKHKDIFPLKKTKFKDFYSYIPNNYNKILESQYKNYKENIVFIFDNRNNEINFLLSKTKKYKKNTKIYELFNTLNKINYEDIFSIIEEE